MTIPRPWWDSRAFVVAAIVLSALPMLWPSLPPLVDLPGHVGRYHVMADLARSADLQRHWSYHWAAIGNLGVDLLVWPLAPLIGVEAAAKLVVVLIPPLTVASLIWLSREARGSLSPTAAFAFPLAYAWPLQLGFVNYALAAALALAALAGWIRLGRQRRYVLRAAIFVPVSLALWLAHSFGWAMFGLLALVAEIAQRRGRGDDWLRALLVAGGWCIGLAAPLVLMIAGHASGPGGLAIGWDPIAKLVWITSLLRERWKWYDIASALFLYFTLWAAVRHREYRFDPLLGALALTALALFLVLPRLMMGGAYVDMRILPTAVVLGLIAIRPDQAIAHRTALLAVGFFAVRTIGTTVAFLIFAQGQQQAAAAIAQLPRGAAVLVLVDQPCSYEWHSSRTEHVGSLAIARADAFENGEWTLPGQQLLRDRHPAAAPYAADPSQLVYPKDCEAETTDFGGAVRGFDRGTFDHVWTIGFPARARLAPDVRLVWHNDTSALYAVDRWRRAAAAMTILLTGSSRGIGAAIAAALTDAGAEVIGHGTVSGIPADFADPAAPAHLWQAALDRAGGTIDVLVNNAGIFEANPLAGDDWTAAWERTMRVNLTAAAELCRLAVLHWQKRGTGGRIVNVASRAAYRGDSPAHWHYAASKAGMVAMTKTIARGYAAENILAFAICPGFTMTGMADDYLASRGGDKLLADIPLGKVADPAEIASVARYLALEAPPSMTGAVIDVNGASYVR